MKYDIVIVGASLAGLYSAIKLSKNNFKVCIIDKKEHIGLPIRCGEATGNLKELERFFKMEPDWISQEIKGMSAHINGEEALAHEMDDLGVILNRDKFEQGLADKATSQGANLILNTYVTNLIKTGDKYSGVKLENGETVEGNLIIGADGAEAHIGQMAGIVKSLPSSEVATTLQYTIKSKKYNNGHLHFFIGSKSMPKGYIWVFPKDKDHVSVGGALYGINRKMPKIKKFVDDFVNEYYSDCPKDNLITGAIPITICPKEFVKDNVIIVGDSARMVNPLTAGGIMNTFEAADMMCDAIIKSKPSNYSNKIISKHYSKKWAKMPRFQQKVFYLFKELVLDSSDEELLKTCNAAGKVASIIDRDKPFQFSLSAYYYPFKIYLWRALKLIGILFR